MVLKSFLRVRTCKRSPLLLQDNEVVIGQPRRDAQPLTKSNTDHSRNTADNSWNSQLLHPDDVSSIHYGESVGSPNERHVAMERDRLQRASRKSRTELDGMTGKTASFSEEDEDEDGDDHDHDHDHDQDHQDIVHKHLDDVHPGPIDVDEAIYDPYEDQQETMYRKQLQKQQQQQRQQRAKKGNNQKSTAHQSQKDRRNLLRAQQQAQPRTESLTGPQFTRSLTDEDFERVLNETGAEVPDPIDLNVSSFTSATEVELDYDDNTNVELVGRHLDDSDERSTKIQIVDGPEVQSGEFVEDFEELRKCHVAPSHRRQRSDKILAAAVGPVDDEECIDENPVYMAKDMSVFCVSLLKQNHSYMRKHGLLPPSDEKSEYVPPKSPSERVVRDTLQRHLDRFVQVQAIRTGREHHRRQSRRTIQRKLTKDMLKDPVVIERMAQECLGVGDYEQAIKCYAFLLEKQQTMADAETAETLTKLSLLHLSLGNRNRSIAFAKRALKWNREESRREATTVTLLLIGLIYFAGNKPEKALTTWREALQMSCLVFGYDHPILATLLNNIGCLHYYRGDLPASLRTFSESLDLQRKFLSTNSTRHVNIILLDIAVTKGNMAIMASKQGDVTAAASLLEEVLSIQESVLMEDRDHFLVTLTKHNLDRLLGNEMDPFDDDDLSGPHEQEARDLFLSGDDSAVAASSAVDSAGMSSRKPYFSSVSTSYKTANTSQNAQKGIQHKDSFSIERMCTRTSRVSSHLSIFGDDDGIPMRRIGAKSPLDAMDATDNLDFLMLGSLAEEQTPRQRIRAAVLKFFNKTLQDDEDRKLPFVPFENAPRRRNRIPIDLDHDNVVDAELYLEGIHDQAFEHLEHNEIDEALELFEYVLSSHKDKFGSIHHLVGTCNHNIGLVYLYAEKYAPAMAFFQEAVAIRQASLGPEHPDVASSLMKIGMIQLARRDADEARDTFKQVLDLARDGLGYGHIQVARVLNNLAVAFYDLGSYLECFEAFEQAYEIQRRLLLLSMSENTAVLNQEEIIEIALSNTLLNMGFLYARQKKYDDALSMLREGSKLRRKHFDAKSPDVLSAQENLEYVRNLVGDVDEADAEEATQDSSTVEEKKAEERPGRHWRELREHSILSATSLSSRQDLLEHFVGETLLSIKQKFRCD